MAVLFDTALSRFKQNGQHTKIVVVEQPNINLLENPVSFLACLGACGRTDRDVLIGQAKASETLKCL
jgi:hypothetical protein